MSVRHFNNFQRPISIILLFSILFVFSCSSDNSITGTQGETLGKISDIINNGDDDIPENYVSNQIKNKTLLGYIALILSELLGSSELKALSEIDDNLGCIAGWINNVINPPSCNINNQAGYDFRDNFLSRSEKGEVYTFSYYLLSYHAIENNLLMQYPLEHISIMETGIKVSRELQHGIIDSKILIDKSTYDDLRKLSKIYRKSENHEEIEPVLDYLEADLEKYYNKPKAEIAADFEF